MGLLAPLFLLGLVGLVVPIVVHLTEKQRRQVVDFPSLMFLRKIPFRSSRRKKIHHWALLSIRALALALLVAAFSRPFFENPNGRRSCGDTTLDSRNGRPTRC